MFSLCRDPCWIIYPAVPALQAGHAHWGVPHPHGVPERAERQRSGFSQRESCTKSCLGCCVSGGGIYSSPAHLPLPCNPLNPLTTGLDCCQLCRASVANGQAASSCLATTKAAARSGLLVPPAMILQSRTNTAQFTDNQVSSQLCHVKNKASLVYMDLTNMDKPQWFSY